jgi:hypothetical protein
VRLRLRKARLRREGNTNPERNSRVTSQKNLYNYYSSCLRGYSLPSEVVNVVEQVYVLYRTWLFGAERSRLIIKGVSGSLS